jgi:hypothetical protein
MHMHGHYENRDEKAGLTSTDLVGAYHGVQRVAPLQTALERHHPPELSNADRDLLLKWLRSDRVSEDYDNLDLGDAAPAEILARSCLQCHSRRATAGDGIGKTMPLDFYDDVKPLAFSRQINPTPVAVLAASTHAHALALGPLAIVVAALALSTSWPRWFIHAGILLMGLGLFGDLASWWLARFDPAFVWGLILTGAVFNGMTTILLLAIGIDLARPAEKR